MGQHCVQEISARYADACDIALTLMFPLASGSDPNRFGPLVPFRQNISTKHQTLRPNPMRPTMNAPAGKSSQAQSLSSRLGTTKNSTIHQPLLLRSCSRLMEMAAKHHVLMMKTGPMVPPSNASVRGFAHLGSALRKLPPIDIGTTIMNIIVQTKLSSMTRQNLARLMRPSKPKKKFQSIAST